MPNIFLLSECSTTESSDDIEKQDMDEASDEDETSFYDTTEYFTEPGGRRGSKRDMDEGNKLRGSLSKCIDLEKTQPDKSVNDSRNLQITRRNKLPDPVEKEKGVSLWSIIKDNVGKDLTRVCLPVYFNEPISSLQKCCEDMEYSYLLDRAYEHGKSVRYPPLSRLCHFFVLEVLKG